MLRELLNRVRPGAAGGERVKVPFRYGINLLPAQAASFGSLFVRALPRQGSWSHAPGVTPFRRRAPAAPRAARLPRAAPSENLDQRLGARLVAAGLISTAQLSEGLMRAQQRGMRLGQALLFMRVITERDLAEQLAVQLDFPFLDLSNYIVDPAIARIVPEHIAHRHALVPINKIGPVLTVAMQDPLNVLALDDIQLMTGLRVRAVVASGHDVRAALVDVYGAQSQLDRVFGDIEGDIARQVAAEEEALDSAGEMGENDAPIIRLVNLILTNAVIREGVSEIRIEPFERELRVRYRQDGVLFTEMTPPKRAQDAILQRLRILANLDSSSHPAVRVGTILIRVNNRRVTVSAVFQPTHHGELVSLAIANDDQLQLLDSLGFEAPALARLRDALQARGGLVILAGPQRSGRSSTLGAIAVELNEISRSVMMVEDRPRRSLHGVVQVPCKPGGYAAALRSVQHLRPEVLLLGDLPGPRAAERVVAAIEGGALVVARMDALDAAAVLERVRALSTGGRSLAAHLRLVSTQRLVPLLCPDCREEWSPPAHLLRELGLTPERLARTAPVGFESDARWFRPGGCDRCGRRGYRGRTGAFEVLALPVRGREALERGHPGTEIVRAALADGAEPLREEVLKKVLAGATSLEEAVGLDRLPGRAAARRSARDEDPAPIRDPFGSLVDDWRGARSPTPPQVMLGVPSAASLVLLEGERVVRRFPLIEGENSVGQSDALADIHPHIDLAEFDPVGLITPHHLRIFIDGASYAVLDEMGSTGTQLNGAPLARLQRTPISPGDRLTFAGQVTLRFELERAPIAN